jgi:hypothetical protein
MVEDPQIAARLRSCASQPQRASNNVGWSSGAPAGSHRGSNRAVDAPSGQWTPSLDVVGRNGPLGGLGALEVPQTRRAIAITAVNDNSAGSGEMALCWTASHAIVCASSASRVSENG